MSWGISCRFIRLIFCGVFVSAFCLSLKAESNFKPTYGYKSDCFSSYNYQDRDYCQATLPKPWTGLDILKLEKSMAPLKKLGKFLNQISENGFTTFNRVTYGVNQLPLLNQIESDKTVQAWVDQTNLTVNFPDKFFLAEDIDSMSGVSIQNITFLHELAHAYDKHHAISESPEFLKIAGWEIDGVFSKYSIIEYFDALTYTEQVIASEGGTDDPTKTFAIDRRLSTQLYHAPRTYSLSSSSEFFADVVAFAFYDPNSKNYLKPELYNWVLKNVLDNQTNYRIL